MTNEPVYPCEHCHKPMVLAPGIDYYCDNNHCPEKKLPEAERLKKAFDHLFKAFGSPIDQVPLTEGTILKEHLADIPHKFPDIPQAFKLITPHGTYEANTLVMLLMDVLKHRTYHLFKGQGWRD